MRKYFLEIIVFISGAIVMILELTGSRILAPYLGTSLITWTSLIGIILGSLSLGYHLGGKIADKKADHKTLAYILFFAALSIGLIALIKEPFLNILSETGLDLRIATTIATIVLFSPASVFMGMVTPYCVKLKLHSLNNCGKTVGNLYAISTIGSIVGTFLAGFLLIPLFGNSKLIIVIALIMLLTSIFIHSSKKKLSLALGLLLLFQLGWTHQKETTLAQAGILDLDTKYSRVLIYNSLDPKTNKPIKLLTMGKTWHSAMFLESNDLVFDYTKFYKLAGHFKPNFKDSLIIGGGAYSFPKYYLENYPRANLDVVEIDEKLTDLAKEHFRLMDDSRLKISHEDGRTFLNKNKKKYDAIFMDAFGTFYAIPYQLTTVEAAQKIHDSLKTDGVVLLNIIGSIKGSGSEFLQAEIKTYQKIFPQVYVFPVAYPESPEIIQNNIIVALKSSRKPAFENNDEELNSYLLKLWQQEISLDFPVLTDDHAPVDQYVLSMIK